MKTRILGAVCALFLLIGAPAAEAQYYQLANQIPQVLSPALSGSLRYKGFVEGGYLKGVGSRQGDLISVTTSQGFAYASWFYMGVGIGIDVLMAHTSNDWGNSWNQGGSFDYHHSSTKTGVMLPLFTDFRFNIGNSAKPSIFFDVKVGATFLLSSDYIEIGNGYLTNSECFMVRPTIGVRIPTNSNNSKQAFNIAAVYNLITNNYWCNWESDVTLSSFGVTLSYEW